MADLSENELNKWLNGELSDADFAKEAGRESFLKYQQILSEVDNWTPDNQPFSLDLKEITHRPKVVKLNPWIYMSAAASVLLVVFLSVWYFTRTEVFEYTAETGEIQEILLPDGVSKAILASGSTLKWSESDWNDAHRNLELKGKGYFQVNPGSPFTVNTSSGNVTVLGTSFEVDQFGSDFSVSCFEGKVKATSKSGKETIVSKGKSFIYFQNQWEANPDLTGTAPAWLADETKFENAPLEQVLQTLKAEYGLVIISDKIKTDRRYSGTIPNDNLELALRLIFTPLKITYELKEKTLYLSE